MQATGSDAGQAEGTNIMKDEKKDFEMKNDAGTDMTEEMPRPEGGAATDGTAKVRVRPKSKAAKAIIDYLDASDEALPDDIGQFEVNDAVTKAVDALYDRYAAEGVVPTREGFAGCCEEPTIGKTVLVMPEDPFARKAMSRTAVAAICAGCGLAVVLLAGGVVWALGSGAPAQEPPAATEAPAAEAEETFVLDIGVSAEGWDEETSSPVIAHIVCEELGIDYYHAYAANESVALGVPGEGDFEVSFISPVNADGSVYRVPGTATVASVPDDEAIDGLPFEFERIPAEDVAADDLTAIVSQVTEAIKSGDETLTGEVGVGIAELVEENSKANPNADDEAVEEESAEASEAAKQGGSTAQTGGSASGGGSSNNGGSGSATNPSGNGGGGSSKPNGSTGGGSSSSKPSGGSGSTSSGGSSSSKPSHTHNWVAQTKTVHHDAEYKTVHHDAEYKTVHHDAVIEYRDICNNCGTDITGNIDAHFKANILNGCGSFTSKPVTVQDAYDEKVLVKDAWDEKVLVQAAWDETVTTGYKCSGCGATK